MPDRWFAKGRRLHYAGAVSSSRLIIQCYRSHIGTFSREHLPWNSMVTCTIKMRANGCNSARQLRPLVRKREDEDCERKAKENNGRGNTRRAQREGECWPGATLKIYKRKTMNPAPPRQTLNPLLPSKLFGAPLTRNFWRAYEAGWTREQNSSGLSFE